MADSMNPSENWDDIRYRITRFGLTIVVMAVCFILYYLGFFGTYDGPLNPGNLGQALDARGVDKAHIAWLFMGMFGLLLTWNWIYNAATLLKGKRLTCPAQAPDGGCCGAGVERRKLDDAQGNRHTRFICENGHVSASARFHPVKKGPWSYCMCLALALISGMCVYWI